MVNMVQIVSPRTHYRLAGKGQPGTIGHFNVLAIRHLAAAGQVLSHSLHGSFETDDI